eukprot:TRINITY_DN8869_c0_g1_i5.p1 TRINITY_DN8869_c0_g1~~TRINITY_DN8869_c0_g1_i5.p1  ORF type:complete len:301 (-),score=16.59 TRINITY_DN8869_c0_g1_i5:80-982(-)
MIPYERRIGNVALLILILGIQQANGQDECEAANHNILDDRRSVNDPGFLPPDGKRYCDRMDAQNKNTSPDWKGPGWYRFEGKATFMPMKTPGAGRCGTGHTGWLPGRNTHPFKKYETKDVTYAWHWGDNEFYQQTNGGKVTDCGDFYVYYLPEPPDCDYRYCGTPTRPECNSYKVLNVYRSINDPGFIEPNKVRYCDKVDYFKQSPDWEGPGWYRFEGEGATEMPTSSPGPQRCATGHTGWVRTDSLPGEYESKSVTICFAWGPNDCYQSVTGKVSNCKDFFVYYLPRTPGCDYRYCGTT